MRKLLFILMCVGALTACQNSVTEEVEKVEENTTRTRSGYCDGHGGCLPEISIAANDLENKVVVSWKKKSDCNSVYLRCYTSFGESITKYLGQPYMDEDYFTFYCREKSYSVSYSVYCNSSNQCLNCIKQGTFVKKAYNSGIMGGPTDCQKYYHEYSVNVQSEYALKLSRAVWKDDPMRYEEDYLTIDSYAIYRNENGQYTCVQYGSMSQDSMPIYFYSGTLGYHYEVRYYSSACKYSKQEHYLYVPIYVDGSGLRVGASYPYTYKNHGSYPGSHL